MHFKNYFLFEYAPIIKLSSRIKQNTKQIKTKKYKSKIIKCKNNFLIFCYHKTIKHRFNAKWLSGGCGGCRGYGGYGGHGGYGGCAMCCGGLWKLLNLRKV